MLYPLMKAVHYVGLIALLGGVPFFHLVWRPGLWPRSERRARRISWGDQAFLPRLRTTTTVGWVLVAAVALLDVLRMTYEFYGTGEVRFFLEQLVGTRAGRMMGLRVVSATICWLAGVASFTGNSPMRETALASARRSGHNRALSGGGWTQGVTYVIQRVWIAAAAVIGTGGVIASVSATSHQASKGMSWPLVADGVHVIATVLWAGGLLYLSLVPWSVMRREPGGGGQLARIAGRFSRLALLCVASLMVTGTYMVTLHFTDLHALTATVYGRALLTKLGLIVAAMAVASVHFTYTVPALSAGDGRARMMAQRFLTLVRWEAMVVLGVLVAVGFLTTQSPP